MSVKNLVPTRDTVVIESHVCDVIDMEECSSMYDRGLITFLGERIAENGSRYCFYKHNTQSYLYYASPVMQLHSGN